MISCKEYYNQEILKITEEVSKRPDDDKGILHIFQVGHNGSAKTYTECIVKDCTKVGIECIMHCFDEDIDSDSFVKELSLIENSLVGFDVESYKKIYKTGGILIQEPLPKNIQLLKEKIHPFYDVDGVKYFKDYHYYEPCTPRGIMNWLDANHIELEGMNVTIIGRSKTVGAPLAHMMMSKNATVTVCHSKTRDLSKLIEHADIVISAAGVPGLLNKEDMSLTFLDCSCKLFIDIGTSFVNDKLCGDIDEEFAQYCEECGSRIIRSKNGMGLCTRIALLKNVIKEV